MEKNHLKDDFFGFSAYLAEQAEICESFHPLPSYCASQKDVRGKKTEHPKKNTSSCTIHFGDSGKEEGRQTTAVP